jgi:hypothetical protein
VPLRCPIPSPRRSGGTADWPSFCCAAGREGGPRVDQPDRARVVTRDARTS